MNATCYHCEPGYGYSDEREIVNGVVEAATRSRHFVNPSEGEGSASWTSEDHGKAGNVNQTDDVASGAEMGFSRVIVPDPGPQVWGYDSCSCSGFCSGCVVDVSGAGSRFVFDNSRDHGHGRNHAYGHRPWAVREEGEVAYLLDSLVLCASYPPRDASVCPSPSSPPPTSLSELGTSLSPHPASSRAQPSQRFASVCFLPAFRGQRHHPRRSLGVAFRVQRPYGPTPLALRRPDRVCHGP